MNLRLLVVILELGVFKMNKRFRLASMIAAVFWILAGCANNEANSAEYTSSTNTPVVEVSESIESDIKESSIEVVDESLVDEVVSESALVEEEQASLESEEVSEEIDESIEEDAEGTVSEQRFTNYDVQNDTIEDERIRLALSKTIEYLKANQLFFDVGEYHFIVNDGAEVNTLAIEVSQRYSNGLEKLGSYTYDYDAKVFKP